MPNPSCDAPALTALVEVLERRAIDTPDHLAFDVRGRRLTWRTLFDGALRAAAALAARGASPGAPCAVVLSTSPEFFVTFFGAQLLGAIPVAMNPRMPPAQAARRLGELDCPLAVVSPERHAAESHDALSGAVPTMPATDVWDAVPLSRRGVRWPGPDDLSHLQLTSGTTGAPRAAMIRHRNVVANVENARDAFDPSPADVMVGWLPLHHDLGLVRFVFESVYFGCPSYLLEPVMPALPAWLETIGRVGGTITAAPDFVYRVAPRLVEAGRVNIRTLRIATNGGEVVRHASIRAFESHFDVPGVVQPGYGLAESTLGVTLLRPGQALRTESSGAVSCGTPLRNVTVRIADEADRPVPTGQRGRILVNAPTVFAGYRHDPAASAAILRNGWLDTGDVGLMDDQDHLFVLGRVRAMIKRAGATIAPREIEEIVDEVPGVRRSAAVGVDTGPDGGTEEVCVVMEVERSVDAAARVHIKAAAMDAVRRALGFAPGDVRLVAPGAIPRTTTGKTQYAALGDLIRSSPAGALGVRRADSSQAT